MKNRLVEITDVEQKREKRLERNEDSLRELWDNIKHTNIRIIRVPEGEKREKETEKIFQETIAENFLTWERNHSLKSRKHESYKINSRRNILRPILTKLTKIKYTEKILKAAREKKQITCKGTPIRLSADFSAETLQAKREWHDILNMMKGKKPPTKITLPSKALIQI